MFFVIGMQRFLTFLIPIQYLVIILSTWNDWVDLHTWIHFYSINRSEKWYSPEHYNILLSLWISMPLSLKLVKIYQGSWIIPNAWIIYAKWLQFNSHHWRKFWAVQFPNVSTFYSPWLSLFQQRFEGLSKRKTSSSLISDRLVTVSLSEDELSKRNFAG